MMFGPGLVCACQPEHIGNADLPSLGIGTYFKVMFCLIGIVRIGGGKFIGGCSGSLLLADYSS